MVVVIVGNLNLLEMKSSVFSLRIMNFCFTILMLITPPLHCSYTSIGSVEARTNRSETTINTGDVYTIGH